MARITNEKLFGETPCTCFPINPDKPYTPENLLCYSQGAIGVLSDRQDKMCKDQVILPTPPSLQVHLKKFAMMGDILSVCMKEDTEKDFYDCIEHEASKKLKPEKIAKKPKIEREKPPIPVKEEEEPEWKPEVRVIKHAKFEEGKLVTPVKPKEKAKKKK